MKKIRNLKANEIECRPQSVKDGKVTLLLYIDSRAATDLLDEVYGMSNWNIEYKDVAGQIYGRLSIYDEESDRWVYREDTGSPANIEKEKSLASDIIKRCIVRFGLTSLYSAPKIVIDDDKYGNTGYKVTEIEYDEKRNITHLVIANRFGKEVFRWSKNAAVQPTSKHTVKVREDLEWKPSEGEAVNKVDYRKILTDFCAVQKTAYGVDKDNLLKFFNFYGKKVDDWRGDFDPQRLWNGWNSKKSA